MTADEIDKRLAQAEAEPSSLDQDWGRLFGDGHQWTAEQVEASRSRVRHPAYLAEQERLNKLSARALDVIKTAPRKP